MTEQPDSLKLDHLIDLALAEDIGPGDITTEAVVSADTMACARFIAHQEGVVSGMITIAPLFHKIDPEARYHFLVKDGDRVHPDQELGWVAGHARGLLAGERIALNFLQRLSGIASYARRCVDALGESSVKILDTRKTIPGWRQLEKYAARCGGARNHRMGLYDMVLIKENHQEISHRGLREAIHAAREAVPAGVMIEIEVHDLDHALDAVEAGADVIMLDNMSRDEIRRGSKTIREAAARLDHRVIIETSGGINLANLHEYGDLDIDWISLGAITHSAPALDISLDIEALDNMNPALLSRLKSHHDRWVDPHSLARDLDLSLHLLQRELDALAGVGYRIESCPRDGIRLVGMPDGLQAWEIEWDLGTEVIGRRVIVEPEVASTNDVAWRQIASAGWSAEVSRDLNGLVVIAERQTAGRGRLGRSWESPPGGLWMSVVLRAPQATQYHPLLTIAAAVAVAHAVRDTARLDATIRWPNDVMIDNRKVAGVLVEARSAHPDMYVLGIGVNVNLRHEDLPAEVRTQATSLRVETGHDVSCTQFARALLRQLDRWDERIRRGDTESLNTSWRELASTLGQRTIVQSDGKSFEGVVVELGLFEGISLRFDRGGVRTFRSEEVTGVQVME